MRFRSSFPAALLLVAALLLSACESSEERAEKYFQSALTLLAAGDEERAIVEFRNVFQLNDRHREARSRFAALQRQRGNTRAAIGQYLLLVEQYPDDFDGQIAISKLYAETGNLDGLGRHLAAASKLGIDHPALNTLQTILDYQALIDGDDAEALADVILRTADLVAEFPENSLLRKILIDNHVRQANYDLALMELDRAIERAPDDRRLYLVRLAVLSSLGDAFGIETQLKEMIDRFPDDTTSRASLVRWYVSQGQLDEAEQYLRAAAQGGEASVEDRVTLIQFLMQLRGEDVALAELNDMVATGISDPMILGLRAGFEFDRGNRDAAIAQLRESLEGMPPSHEIRQSNLALSQMLAATGNKVGARAIIEQVLQEDSSNVAALKLQAGYLIDGDQADQAILALRTALDQEPKDADILTLLARAYERDGNQELVGEMLALAMTASDGAPQETVRYAQYLFLLEKFTIAESVLVDSLRLAPGNLAILSALGTVYVRTEDWLRADQVQATLRKFGTELAISASNDLQARIYQGQKNLAETISFLEDLIDQGQAGFGANLAIVRNYLSAGDQQKAIDFVTRLLSSAPDDPAVRFLSASVDLAVGKPGVAEKKFRALVTEDNSRVQVWIALYRLLAAIDRPADASAVIDEATAAVPDEPTLQWIQASILEADGDLGGAIAVYERMYAVDSGNLIIANNLASLLSTARDDPASIERAATIARRLRSSKVAPFQDTYGWIAYLRGDNEQAIASLEPAAQNLGRDAAVQYHLARAYLAAKNPSGALAQFEKVVALTGAADTRDFVVEARREINNLKAELSDPAGN